MEIMLTNVVLMFPQVFVPKAGEAGQTAYFSGLVPIVPGSANHKLLVKAINQVVKDEFKAKADAVLEQMKVKDNVFFRESEKTNSGDGEITAGFEDRHWLKTSRGEDVGPPTVINGLREPIGPRDGKIRSGCICNVSIDVWAQNNKHAKRVNGRLLGVQYLRQGESYGGGVAASPDKFPEVAMEEEETVGDLD